MVSDGSVEKKQKMMPFVVPLIELFLIAHRNTMSEEYDVVLYLYDMSQGMAKMMSLPLLGKQIDGIWHTGIIAYGYEYYYGGGIQASRPGQSMAGRPTQIIPLGRTRKTQADFHAFLRTQANNFTPDKYNLLTNNCNNFTSTCSRFLLDGFDIPSHILTLPQDALSTPMGQMFRPMLEQMQGAAAANSGVMPWQERDAGSSLWLPPVGREGISTVCPQSSSCLCMRSRALL